MNFLTADNRAIELIENIKTAKAHIKKWERYEEPFKKELMNDYFSRCEELLDAEGHLIANAKLETYNKFDMDSFKKDYPELFVKYSSEGTKQPLRIK